jgi:hypothetical protein
MQGLQVTPRAMLQTVGHDLAGGARRCALDGQRAILRRATLRRAILRRIIIATSHLAPGHVAAGRLRHHTFSITPVLGHLENHGSPPAVLSRMLDPARDVKTSPAKTK